MGTYIVLTKMAGAAMRSEQDSVKDAIKDGAPESRKLIEKHGGKLLEACLTLGAYDGAAIVEFPSDLKCAQAMLAWREFGVTTETLPAWPEKAWGKMAAVI